MKTARKWDCLLRGVKGFLSFTAGLIFVSLALGYKAWLIHDQADFGEILFWLFLAAWRKALAIGVMGVFLILVIIRAARTCQERKGFQVARGSRKNIMMIRSLMGGRVRAGGTRHA